jgi:molybdopterin-guanine dinucleotide biosynthesis protein A
MGADKALLVFDGEPLVLRVARRLSEVANPIVLAPGRAGRLGIRTPYEEVEDEVPASGPLGGLVAGVDASPHPLTAVIAVDLPFISPAVVRLLVTRHAGHDAVVPVTDSGPEPLHAVYAKSALEPLRTALAERRLGLRSVLRGMRVAEVPEADWRSADLTGRFALNLNTVVDLGSMALEGAPTGCGAPSTSASGKQPSDEVPAEDQ